VKKTPVLLLLASIALISMMVLSACGGATETTVTATKTVTATPTATTTATTPAKQVEKVYKVINPVGNYIPVETKGLAPRLDTLAGKRIYFHESEANPRIMPELYRQLKAKFPTAAITYWASASFGDTNPTDDLLKNAQCCIRGIAW
jgi:hypothetical protein